MNWINTTELVAMLKRFGEEVETKCYLGSGFVSTHRWQYLRDKHVFMETTHSTPKAFAEADFHQYFPNTFWQVKPFHFLKTEKEKQLAIRMVEDLATLGHLSDIITEYGIDSVRVCEHCQCLMDEGWLVDDTLTFCSDECLKVEMPDADITELKAHACEDGCSAYWTKWEG